MQGIITVSFATLLAAVSLVGALSGPARAGAQGDVTIEAGFMALNLDFSRSHGVTVAITARECGKTGACQGLRILRRS